jgi:hypothetical protein
MAELALGSSAIANSGSAKQNSDTGVTYGVDRVDGGGPNGRSGSRRASRRALAIGYRLLAIEERA